MGKPLENAVKEDNYEKVEYLLEVGAIPSINNPIKYAKNFDMVKLLVSNGSDITNEVFSNVCGDLEAVEFLIKNGVDPNFEQGFPLRTVVRTNNLEVIKFLIANGARVSERRYMAVKVSLEHGSVEVLKYFLEELKSEDDGFKNDASREKLINDWKIWNSASRKTTEDIKNEMNEIMETYR
jgi:ankyrin repeat protein